LLLVPNSTFAANPSCNGKYKSGGMPSKPDFETILKKHQEWLSIYKEKVRNTTPKERADDRRANLCNANLQRLDLKDMDLSGADLRGTNFGGNNLTGIVLDGADLEYADMTQSILKDVKFAKEVLSFVNL